MAIEPLCEREIDNSGKEFAQGADYPDRQCCAPLKAVGK